MSFGDMFMLMDKLAEMKERRLFLEAIAKEIISREGGIVEEVRRVDSVLRSPFKGSAAMPIYIKVLCQYPSDRGFWLIRGDRDGPTLWAWESALGNSKPPIEHSDEALMIGNSILLPFWFRLAVSLAIGIVLVTMVVYLARGL